MKRLQQHTYFDPHETHRLKELEGVKLASFRKRMAAMTIDLAFVASSVLILLLIGSILSDIPKFVRTYSAETHIAFNEDIKNPFVQFGILLGYFGLVTYFTNGKTLGKWVMRIRVLSTVHEKMNLWHSLERGLGYLASSLEFGFGFMQYFINPNHRCVHDRIAETIVVEERVSRRLKRVDPV